ncbi:hypothetical protein IW262DRAFT_1296918 [Armillaria fumosa]|nr:hypothetical protein IW262DRAFT_1296918 [Armillaria fumosa]
MKTMQIFGNIQNPINDTLNAEFAANINWTLIYTVLVLATTVMCMLLIVYCIIWHAAGMNASHKIIEMLIESSALYSISLIIYLALVPKNSDSGFYMDIVATYAQDSSYCGDGVIYHSSWYYVTGSMANTLLVVATVDHPFPTLLPPILPDPS